MTLGPDDLPEDVFEETGLAQIGCQCTNDLLHVITRQDGTVLAVCPQCPLNGGRKRVVMSWPPAQLGIAAAPDQPQPLPQVGMPPLAGGGQVAAAGAAWGDEIPWPEQLRHHPPAGFDPRGIESAPDPADVPTRAGEGIAAPTLGGFSPGMCNAVLEGGPHDPRLTWIINDDQVTFAVVGEPGSYEPTDARRGGRIVWQWQPSSATGDAT